MSRLSAQTLGTNYRLVAAWVDLASILNDVISVINGSPEKIHHDSSVSKLSDANRRLLSWFVNLAQELQWSANCSMSPSICALHIQFLSTSILLNRPFAAYMCKRGSKLVLQRRCLEGQTPQISQQICTTNAVRISKLLLTYRQRHGASRIYSTVNPACLGAAMALISDIVSAEADEDKRAEINWLAAILETLEEISPWYPIAERSRNTLTAIMKACGLSGVSKPISTTSGNNSQAKILPNCSPAEAPRPGWDTDPDMPVGLGFPFDSGYNVHDISLMDFYAQPSHMMELTGWGTEDPLFYGLSL